MKKIIFLFILCSNFSANAQTGLGLWASASVEKKLNKKFTISLDGQARFVENISYLQTYLADFGLDYKINKHFNIAGNYRFSSRRKNELKDFKNRHRFYGDLSYNNKFKKFKFENRLRYQHQFQDNDGEIGFDASYLRNKVEFSFPNKSKLTPYLSGDLFYKIGNQFDQVRPKIGATYKINKSNSIDASVLTNIDLTGIVPANPIIGFNYKLKL